MKTTDSLRFLPVPRKIIFSNSHVSLENQLIIQIASLKPAKLLFTAKRIQTALMRSAGVQWSIQAGLASAPELVGLRLEIDPGSRLGEQGYLLWISPDGISIKALTEIGLFYGICTLIQILAQYGRDLPCLEIEDWPDFQARGVMLDISRDKVPTMNSLNELVDRLASWKINQLQLYTEHTFAYLNHPDVWQNASPMTGQEILELDAYCRERFIELVPNQNSFGHMERWLKHPRYAKLAEFHGEFDVPWGKMQGPFSLSPANPGSLRLVKSLYDELLPHFSSRMVNVGCDETFDVGVGQSKQLCAVSGAERVMLDYLMELNRDVKARGFRMQYWADIIVHHPNLMQEAPKDALALIWNYEGSQSFEDVTASFERAGLPFYVCPGTSSWNSLGGRVHNMLANALDAAHCGLDHGAAGYLITDWGDNGHWQAPPFNLPGFAAGAAFSWCVDQNQDSPMEPALSRFGFEDESEVIGRVLTRLGNVYRLTGMDIPNSSALFWILRYSLDELRGLSSISDVRLQACQAEIEAAVSQLEDAHMNRPDTDLILREINLTGRMMLHACQRGFLLNEKDPAKQAKMAADLLDDAVEWLEEYRLVWLERNRPGGLADSVKNLDRLLDEYRAIQRHKP